MTKQRLKDTIVDQATQISDLRTRLRSTEYWRDRETTEICNLKKQALEKDRTIADLIQEVKKLEQKIADKEAEEEARDAMAEQMQGLPAGAIGLTD